MKDDNETRPAPLRPALRPDDPLNSAIRSLLGAIEAEPVPDRLRTLAEDLAQALSDALKK